MTMAPACPPPCAIKCCSGECALTKPPPVRDWDWQSFAILPNFTRGRSRWTTHLWAVCARASVYPAECLVLKPKRSDRETLLQSEIHLSALTNNALCNPEHPTFCAGYAASRISSNLKGRTSKFGWLQASAINCSFL